MRVIILEGFLFNRQVEGQYHQNCLVNESSHGGEIAAQCLCALYIYQNEFFVF